MKGGAHPLPLDSGESSHPEADGSTQACRCREELVRPYLQFRVSRSTLKAATKLANDAGMSQRSWARMVIELAIADAERGVSE